MWAIIVTVIAVGVIVYLIQRSPEHRQMRKSHEAFYDRHVSDRINMRRHD